MRRVDPPLGGLGAPLRRDEIVLRARDAEPRLFLPLGRGALDAVPLAPPREGDLQRVAELLARLDKLLLRVGSFLLHHALAMGPRGLSRHGFSARPFAYGYG